MVCVCVCVYNDYINEDIENHKVSCVYIVYRTCTMGKRTILRQNYINVYVRALVRMWGRVWVRIFVRVRVYRNIVLLQYSVIAI